ncbi:MAG: signal peptidase I, partial [Candidatus Electrothrix sp. AR5]|nr:signal peptidase I [Candidatus Electrothrix sp. AR5]
MKNNQAEKQKSATREYTEAIVIALILALFIRTFIVQAFKIPSGSMLQTLLIGDHILVSKFIYGIKNPFTDAVLIPIKSPKRGDIAVFKYPKDPKLDYIKRVIATAGDTVEIKDKKLFLNGEPPEDHYGEFRDTHVLPPSEGPR